MKRRVEVTLPCDVRITAYRHMGWWYLEEFDPADDDISFKNVSVMSKSLPSLAEFFKDLVANTPQKERVRP